MLSPTELGRRITSAQDRLRAARRDGRFEDIVTWRDELDALLEQWPKSALEQVSRPCATWHAAQPQQNALSTQSRIHD